MVLHIRTVNNCFSVRSSLFPKKSADTWGAKLIGVYYVGPNLLGQLLMELRDNPTSNVQRKT